MAASHIIDGFSKMSRTGKLKWLKEQGRLSVETEQLINSHLHPESNIQEVYGDISENTISNFFLPVGLAPNFLVNENLLAVPMVTEESSVVAAAANAAKFWAMHGGFHCTVKDVLKTGQVHFNWTGEETVLHQVFQQHRTHLLDAVKPITYRMEKRGGGIDSMEIRKTGEALPTSYQLFVLFRTANAMGANFINSVLELLAIEFQEVMANTGHENEMEIIMSILSNYTPECLVTCSVEARSTDFDTLVNGMKGSEFASKFTRAVEIAREDPYRAVTHNKGIFNGMDAVIIATGNDYRAVESCGHAYASRNGKYQGLSVAHMKGDNFRFSMEVPLALGTVGGLTGTHPMASAAMEILGHPSAEQLMQITAAAGLANNFSAVRSLVTTGIQQGHMKMHLGNILRQLNASKKESDMAISYFESRTISHANVVAFLALEREKKQGS